MDAKDNLVIHEGKAIGHLGPIDMGPHGIGWLAYVANSDGTERYLGSFTNGRNSRDRATQAVIKAAESAKFHGC